MCRFLAYAGEPVFLDTLLIEPASSLVSQSLAAREAKTTVNGDGCGVGWYGARPDPGIYRGTLPAWSDANLASLCRQVSAPMFLAHVRSATSGEVSMANCHPFAAGRHLFMHNGQIGGYDRIRRSVEAMIPDDLYARRRGNGDSEAIFLASLGHGLDTDPLAAIAHSTAAEVRARSEARSRNSRSSVRTLPQYRRWVEVGQSTHLLLLESQRLQAYKAVRDFYDEDFAAE